MTISAEPPVAVNGFRGTSKAAKPSSNGLRWAFDLPDHPDTAERIILGIVTLFERLERLDTLEPVVENGRLFNQLFDLVTTSKTTSRDDNKILSDARVVSIIPKLWKLWGTAEYNLERGFARKVIAGTSQSSCLKIYDTFPYLDQYRQLARMEVNTIDTALGELSLPPIRRIAFLGSGPTPFTSLCIQERYGPEVALVNIDRSPEAIQLGSDLVRRCGFINIGFQEAEVASLSDLRSFDLVHFAALLGDDPEQKRDLLIRVAKCMRPGALILLRTTESLRSILYPPFQPDDREILGIVTPVVATRYFGASTSLTAIVMSVDAPTKSAS